MAVTSAWFGKGLMEVCKGKANWIGSSPTNVKVALYSGSTPLDIQANWDYKDDITGLTEVSTEGYTARGKTLTNPNISYADRVVKLFSDDASLTWTTSTISATYAIIYYDTGTDSTSPLLGYINFGETKVSSSGDFTITWSANGILKLTVGAEA